MELIPADVPVFRCTPHRASGATVWRFWCPWCRTTHVHGAVAGHRHAHCADGPFRARGYFLIGPREMIAERLPGHARAPMTLDSHAAGDRPAPGPDKATVRTDLFT